MTPAEVNLFRLAEHLGMLVGDIKARMSVSEYHGWIRYMNEQTREREQADNPLASGDAMLRAFNLG